MAANSLKGSLRYICSLFSKYYKENAKTLRLPHLMENREFAFLLLQEQIMLRHKGFKNQGEFAVFLEGIFPSDIYYSCAYYADPKMDMDRKGWLGADLIFDIDADHISTPCNKIHDEWTCGNCGFIGVGITPPNCPVCDSQKFNVKSWPCEVCLESAKKETVKLLEMLMNDFGFSQSEMHVFFSGHRGYHLHVENEAVKSLDAISRKEIVDYVSGLGMKLFSYESSRQNLGRTQGFTDSHLANFGWYKRLVQGMRDFVSSAKEEDFKKIGLKKNVVAALLRQKDSVLKNWLTTGTLGSVRGVGPESWSKIAEHSMKSQSAQIDTVVTTDIHRLIRLADTLHGKTGLKKVEFPISIIDDFDPFKNAIAFKEGNISVFVYGAPKIRLGDGTFGPYKNQKAELPTAAAVLLICKGRAEVAE